MSKAASEFAALRAQDNSPLKRAKVQYDNAVRKHDLERKNLDKVVAYSEFLRKSLEDAKVAAATQFAQAQSVSKEAETAQAQINAATEATTRAMKAAEDARVAATTTAQAVTDLRAQIENLVCSFMLLYEASHSCAFVFSGT